MCRVRPTWQRDVFYAKIDVLVRECTYRMDDLMAALDVRLRPEGRRLVGPCPVHGGGDTRGIHLYTRGNRPTWKCYTGGCEEHFGDNLLGLVGGVLSHQQFGWGGPKDKRVHREESAAFLCQFLDMEWDDIVVDLARCGRDKYATIVESFTAEPKDYPTISDREHLRARLDIPAAYYVDRGFSPGVLDAHDVGYNAGIGDDRLADRIVIPFYNAHREDEVIGYVGRSPHPRCEQCRYWHADGTECYQDGGLVRPFVKAVTSRDFNDKDVLYHYWHARPFIEATRQVVVVEGAADAWRLCEAGIINVVAVGGSSLSDPQRILFDNQGVRYVIAASDNDEAGDGLYRYMKEECVDKETFRVRPPGKDFGEATVEQILDIPAMAAMLERLESVPSYPKAIKQCRGK